MGEKNYDALFFFFFSNVKLDKLRINIAGRKISRENQGGGNYGHFARHLVRHGSRKAVYF